MSVVGFPAKKDEELVLACDCGSTTFRILSTGLFECSVCNEVIADDMTGVDYSEIQKAEKPTELKSQSDFNCTDLAFHRVLSKADPKQSAAVVVMNLNGGTSVWSIGADSDEEKAWFQTRIDDLPKMIFE